jgi:formate dehydrogenase accessory protein FdhD
VAAALPPAVREVAALRIDRGERQSFSDAVIEEAPIALLYNGVAHAVMMATPADLEDYALGYSLAEGVVEEPGELRYVEALDTGMGIVVEMLIPQARFDLLGDRRRALVGTSGCGLCGVESLQAALRPAPVVPFGQRCAAAAIGRGVHALAEAQVLNRRSGGVHAAGYVHADGILVREDVGRHNALDKLVGALRRGDAGEGFLVLSSRASYELVHKAACAGIGIVVAISAPTTLAIDLAQSSGITLVGFARGEQMNVYTHADRIA